MVHSLSKEFRESLTVFNEKANKLINSSFKKESEQERFGETLSWQLNEKTGNLDFSYETRNQDPDFINSVILPLRMFIQDNEQISIRNITKFYDNENIEEKFKTTFSEIRQELNIYLDEKAKTLLDDKPTRRDLLYTIVYGDFAHVNLEKRRLLEKWKEDTVSWDLAFVEFQRILHEFINYIELFRNVNDLVLKDK